MGKKETQTPEQIAAYHVVARKLAVDRHDDVADLEAGACASELRAGGCIVVIEWNVACVRARVLCAWLRNDAGPRWRSRCVLLRPREWQAAHPRDDADDNNADTRIGIADESHAGALASSSLDAENACRVGECEAHIVFCGIDKPSGSKGASRVDFGRRLGRELRCARARGLCEAQERRSACAARWF